MQSSQLAQLSKEELIQKITEIESNNQRLVQQNLKLVLLCKEKDRSLYEAELVIRKYRSRLIRWFEDMVYDPLDASEGQLLQNTQSTNAQIKIELESKRD